LHRRVERFGRDEEFALRPGRVFDGSYERATDTPSAERGLDDEQPHEGPVEEPAIPRNEARDHAPFASDEAAAARNRAAHDGSLSRLARQQHVRGSERWEVARARSADR